MENEDDFMVVSNENRREIFYNLINSGLAGGLVFFGSIMGGGITPEGALAALAAAGVVFLGKFKAYWEKEKGEYSSHYFAFL